MRGGFEGLAAALRERADAGLLRERRILESAQGTRVRIDGRELLAFCSNDYLGLAAEPRVVKALQDGAARWGVGSGASHLVSGHMQPHHELEERLADFTGRERALLFSSGYAANLGVCCALLARGDAIFEDRLNHASLLDGGLLSGARLQRFLHNDAASLAAKLERTQAVRALVAVDGVFSMDGDIAPLPALARTAAAHGAWLYVDDAHGFGVLGERGAGSLEHCGLGSAEVPLLMATLGKSLGVGGAFVAGDAVAIDTLVQHARTFIYTTAMPPALAVAAIAALDILQSEPWRREHLRALIAHFRAGCATLGLQLPASPTAIQPVILGTPERALACAEALRREGILVPAIRPPTVPAGSSRLRITLSAAHGMPDVDRLLEALARVIPR